MIKYTSIVLLFISIISISASFTTAPPADDEFKNLKVLPKNITDEQLDSVMDHFKASLGVKCSFCHAESKDTSAKRKLDFASDEKEEKQRAREMMKMTTDLNANYFNPGQSTKPDTIHEVICYTCHRGTKEPEAALMFSAVDSIMKAQHKK